MHDDADAEWGLMQPTIMMIMVMVMMLMLNGADAADANDDNGYGDDDAAW